MIAKGKLLDLPTNIEKDKKEVFLFGKSVDSRKNNEFPE